MLCIRRDTGDQKNVWPEIQIATEGAARLKRMRWTGLPCGFIQKRITRHSKRTVIAPAAGPKSRTEANTNVSETEMYAFTEGTFTVKDPVSSVRPAKNSYCSIGSMYRLCSEYRNVAAPTSTTTLI